MNNTEKELIIQLLKGREDLICDYLFLRSYSEVKKNIRNGRMEG